MKSQHLCGGDIDLDKTELIFKDRKIIEGKKLFENMASDFCVAMHFFFFIFYYSELIFSCPDVCPGLVLGWLRPVLVMLQTPGVCTTGVTTQIM